VLDEPQGAADRGEQDEAEHEEAQDAARVDRTFIVIIIVGGFEPREAIIIIQRQLGSGAFMDFVFAVRFRGGSNGWRSASSSY